MGQVAEEGGESWCLEKRVCPKILEQVPSRPPRLAFYSIIFVPCSDGGNPCDAFTDPTWATVSGASLRKTLHGNPRKPLETPGNPSKTGPETPRPRPIWSAQKPHMLVPRRTILQLAMVVLLHGLLMTQKTCMM